ncbi:5-oxoprolinase/urea amidolyase family protein [Paraburkholderia dipogonis]|uniref:5-oxoprolinase/urea amidolyase family protein n=1 Tax=Paraburkholderia dipogonis TaxID=1211383 RepID=A0A4Y8MJ35_9BURK|nr:urea amidolyase family protein [Paraburkholderia dipogonis]TFE37383.1 5-oxoprolinase/urea amidolyase family protein [Paraburkholderia dipogonis]
MGERIRILPSGSESLLIEVADLDAALAFLDRLIADRPDGVTDVVPGASTVLIKFNPVLTNELALRAFVTSLDFGSRQDRAGNNFDIPVAYEGEDLDEVAESLGWTVDEVIRRHTDATYTVAFTGFAPGFAYMTCEDQSLDVPRRKSPRVRIPAGSVALAGRFSGVYPSDSPGGWQLIGLTSVRMWDLQRERAALLAPGDTVRFRDARKGPVIPVTHAMPERRAAEQREVAFHVTRADRPPLFQDAGRLGRADQGVSESGALDLSALRDANACVGNAEDAAAIEVSYGGFAIKAEIPATVAITGAPCALTIRTLAGKSHQAPFAQPFALDAGDELSLSMPTQGVRSYIALRGGFQLNTVLGSASFDTLAKIGPSPITQGDILSPARRPTSSVRLDRPAPVPLPGASDIVTLDVQLGPRTDWFSAAGLGAFLDQLWTVTAESSRVGMRLSAPTPLERCNQAELLSEGTSIGAIQVPHNGQPVLFLADHPLTGGYPVIAVVSKHHLNLLGQIPIGARIRFNAGIDTVSLKKDIVR